MWERHETSRWSHLLIQTFSSEQCKQFPHLLTASSPHCLFWYKVHRPYVPVSLPAQTHNHTLDILNTHRIHIHAHAHISYASPTGLQNTSPDGVRNMEESDSWASSLTLTSVFYIGFPSFPIVADPNEFWVLKPGFARLSVSIGISVRQRNEEKNGRGRENLKFTLGERQVLVKNSNLKHINLELRLTLLLGKCTALYLVALILKNTHHPK